MSNPDLSVKKAAIKEILAKDSIAEAIKNLKQWLPPESSKYEDLLLIEARQNEANRNRLRGVLDDRELQLTYNRIREDLLALIDSLQASDFDPSQARSQIAPSKKARRGHVLHRIPNKMCHLQETRCIVRIALDDSTIIENIDLDEHVQLQSVRVSDLMQVELMDPADEPAFAIRAVNTPEQFIDEDDYTEWQFFVKPLRIGTFPLLLKVAVIELVYGKERKREIVLEQAVDIVTVEPSPKTEFEATGYRLDFSTVDSASETTKPPGLNIFRGTIARRAALSMATLLTFVGGAWAVTPTQVRWKAEIEWAATRYLLDNRAAYERYIRRHDQSRHYEMAVWQKTEIVDEPKAYLEYLEEFPEAEAAQADLQLPKLEKKIFEVVSNTTDTIHLHLYIKAFPNSSGLERMKTKLDSIKQVTDYKVVTPESSIDHTSLNEPSSSPELTTVNAAEPSQNSKPSEAVPDHSIPNTTLPDPTDSLNIDPGKADPQMTDPNTPPPTTAFAGNYGTFQDKQGNTYRTLPLGRLTWMADNLELEVADSWCYQDDPGNCATYGRLYTWEAAKKACSSLGNGWRLPTDEEWKSLRDSFGSAQAAYDALLEGGSSGFSAQLGGSRNSDGSFGNLGGYGLYWSATENDSDDAWYYYFFRYYGKLLRLDYGKAWGISCRCVQD